VGEVGEVPEFAEVHAEFEEAVFMERQAAALVVGGDGFATEFGLKLVVGISSLFAFMSYLAFRGYDLKEVK